MPSHYAPEPSIESVQQLHGPLVLEFGTDWCGFCQAAQQHIERVLRSNDGVTHLKVEDGRGRPLGRAYRVKLWPTLIFLKDGIEIARVVRPTDAASISEALAKIV